MSSDLVYYPDSQPGIRRKRCGRGFSYISIDGTTIDGGAERQRLARLAIPPAYENVWISPLVNGHLQATGTDVRSRKQYRYHPAWSQARSSTKFSSLASFGEALPAIRRRIARDLQAEAGELSFALAAAVFLIDRLSLRIGTREYAVQNGSYGALTLKRRHVRLNDGVVHLNFTAKGGKKVNRKIADGKMMRILEKARDLPGADLLVWVDSEGERHTISSTSLNAYLSGISGADFTAKTFRTWAGSVAAFDAAASAERITIGLMAQAASERLFNTPTIAKSSYIHPAVLDLAGKTLGKLGDETISGLSRAENGLLNFLHHVESEAPQRVMDRAS